MNFRRLLRVPKRISQDLKIIRLAKNWKEILSSNLTQEPLLSVKLRNGVVLSSPPEASLNYLFHEIWLDEVYLSKGYEIKPDQIVFDIGGNIGVFALYAATRAANVKVVSFEPFPQNAAYFRQNLQDSKLENVTFYDRAVAGEPGERTLQVHQSWIKHSLNENPSAGGGIAVQCISLDQALENFDRCDLLKLDCEGGEYEILYSSLPATRGKIKRIVSEFHNADDKEKNGASLRKFLELNNYRIDVYQTFDDSSGLIFAKKNEL